MTIENEVRRVLLERAGNAESVAVQNQQEFYSRMVQLGVARKQEYNIPLDPAAKEPTFLIR
jgi:hypothetical protein